MKFGLALFLHILDMRNTLYQIEDRLEDIIFTIGPRYAGDNSNKINVTLTCEADSLSQAKELLGTKLGQIDFFLTLYASDFKISGSVNTVQQIEPMMKVDFTEIKNIIPKITVGERERTVQSSIRGLDKRDPKKYLNSFADIVNILDGVKGKNSSQLCSLRNLIQHKGENLSHFTTNLQKSQNLGLNLETEDGIVIPNIHNVHEFGKKESQLVEEIKNYYKDKYKK